MDIKVYKLRNYVMWVELQNSRPSNKFQFLKSSETPFKLLNLRLSFIQRSIPTISHLWQFNALLRNLKWGFNCTKHLSEYQLHILIYNQTTQLWYIFISWYKTNTHLITLVFCCTFILKERNELRNDHDHICVTLTVWNFNVD